MNNYNYKAQQYCFKNDIKIYNTPVSKKSVRIEVDYKGKIIKSDVIYSIKDSEKKIWELYEYFYNKQKQDE
jgi:hypothetical protein